MYFQNYLLEKTWLLQCISGPISENALEINVLTGPTLCRSLQESTHIPFVHNYE